MEGSSSLGELVFEKVLKKADIKYGLTIGWGKAAIILPHEATYGNFTKDITVNYGGKDYECNLIAPYSTTPSFKTGWFDIVRENNLQVGDTLKFFMKKYPERFAIKVYTVKVYRMGQDLSLVNPS